MRERKKSCIVLIDVPFLQHSQSKVVYEFPKRSESSVSHFWHTGSVLLPAWNVVVYAVLINTYQYALSNCGACSGGFLT